MSSAAAAHRPAHASWVSRTAILTAGILIGALAAGLFIRMEAPQGPTTQQMLQRQESLRHDPRRRHRSAVIERGGQRLLWARGDPQSPQAEWFDVTDSSIDPDRFQYGLGKDAIRAIDDPEFVAADDPRLLRAGIGDETDVIGYANGGEARAYPLKILVEHELVNDRVGGRPVTVGH